MPSDFGIIKSFKDIDIKLNELKTKTDKQSLETISILTAIKAKGEQGFEYSQSLDGEAGISTDDFEAIKNFDKQTIKGTPDNNLSFSKNDETILNSSIEIYKNNKDIITKNYSSIKDQKVINKKISIFAESFMDLADGKVDESITGLKTDKETLQNLNATKLDINSEQEVSFVTDKKTYGFINANRIMALKDDKGNTTVNMVNGFEYPKEIQLNGKKYILEKTDQNPYTTFLDYYEKKDPHSERVDRSAKYFYDMKTNTMVRKNNALIQNYIDNDASGLKNNVSSWIDKVNNGEIKIKIGNEIKNLKDVDLTSLGIDYNGLTKFDYTKLKDNITNIPLKGTYNTTNNGVYEPNSQLDEDDKKNKAYSNGVVTLSINNKNYPNEKVEKTILHEYVHSYISNITPSNNEVLNRENEKTAEFIATLYKLSKDDGIISAEDLTNAKTASNLFIKNSNTYNKMQRYPK